MSPIDVIELDGSGYSRGHQWGELRREQIRACTADWLDSLKSCGIPDPPRYLARMLCETSFLAAIREHAAEMLEELAGIGAATGISPDLLLAAQLMDEEWAYRLRQGTAAAAPEKCSTVAVMAQPGQVWAGQNMDLGGYTDGHQYLLRVAPTATEPGAIIFTIGAMIALMGVNSAGICICVNSLPQLQAAQEGLPVAFLIRGLLRAPSVEQAVDFVASVPHATGQHYLIADAESIRSFEASPAGVIEFRPPIPGRLWHTNHPLVQHPGAGNFGSATANSFARLGCLAARLASGSPDLQAVTNALCSRDDPEHPVCRTVASDSRKHPLTGMTSFTTGSMISALSRLADQVDCWASAGPPCSRGYARFALRKT